MRGNLGSLSTKKTPDETRRDIEETFRKWRIDEWRVPRDGSGERGVARVFFWVNDVKQELACTRFWNYRDNLRAVYLILESLRLAQERGIMRELARAAVAMLPPGQPAPRPWHEVFGVRPDAAATSVEAMYRHLAKTKHPDAGGSDAAMRELNAALEEFKRERGVAA